MYFVIPKIIIVHVITSLNSANREKKISTRTPVQCDDEPGTSESNIQRNKFPVFYSTF